MVALRLIESRFRLIGAKENGDRCSATNESRRIEAGLILDLFNQVAELSLMSSPQRRLHG